MPEGMSRTTLMKQSAAKRGQALAAFASADPKSTGFLTVPQVVENSELLSRVAPNLLDDYPDLVTQDGRLAKRKFVRYCLGKVPGLGRHQHGGDHGGSTTRKKKKHAKGMGANHVTKKHISGHSSRRRLLSKVDEKNLRSLVDRLTSGSGGPLSLRVIRENRMLVGAMFPELLDHFGDADQDRDIYLSWEQLNVVLGGTSQWLEHKLSRIVGLRKLKDQLRNFHASVMLLCLQDLSRGDPRVHTERRFHMVLQGNPGTGKTMMGRIIAEMLHRIGITKSSALTEVQRDELVASYVGQTAAKTQRMIESAKDGVLFVDEAYRLGAGAGKNDFGNEAIDQLMNAMSAPAGEAPVVVLAGYPEDMQDFRHTHPGLFKRVGHEFEFQDYNPKELARILALMIEAKGFVLEKKLADHDCAHLEEIILYKTLPESRSLMNGGVCERILCSVKQSLDTREAQKQLEARQRRLGRAEWMAGAGGTASSESAAENSDDPSGAPSSTVLVADVVGACLRIPPPPVRVRQWRRQHDKRKKPRGNAETARQLNSALARGKMLEKEVRFLQSQLEREQRCTRDLKGVVESRQPRLVAHQHQSTRRMLAVPDTKPSSPTLTRGMTMPLARLTHSLSERSVRSARRKRAMPSSSSEEEDDEFDISGGGTNEKKKREQQEKKKNGLVGKDLLPVLQPEGSWVSKLTKNSRQGSVRAVRSSTDGDTPLLLRPKVKPEPEQRSRSNSGGEEVKRLRAELAAAQAELAAAQTELQKKTMVIDELRATDPRRRPLAKYIHSAIPRRTRIGKATSVAEREEARKHLTDEQQFALIKLDHEKEWAAHKADLERQHDEEEAKLARRRAKKKISMLSRRHLLDISFLTRSKKKMRNTMVPSTSPSTSVSQRAERARSKSMDDSGLSLGHLPPAVTRRPHTSRKNLNVINEHTGSSDDEFELHIPALKVKRPKSPLARQTIHEGEGEGGSTTTADNLNKSNDDHSFRTYKMMKRQEAAKAAHLQRLKARGSVDERTGRKKSVAQQGREMFSLL